MTTTEMLAQSPSEPRTPHPIADIICAWAKGFRVEFRYRHHHPGIPELTYLSDPEWHLCGKQYSAFSGINEHRIHAGDLATWEAEKASEQQAERLSDEEIEIPIGFRVSHVPDWSALTDEANAMNRWQVERIDAPYCGNDGVRSWCGPTLRDALVSACSALGVKLSSQEGTQP